MPKMIVSERVEQLAAELYELSSPELCDVAVIALSRCYPEIAERFAEKLPAPWLRRVADAMNKRIDAEEHKEKAK